MPGRAQSVPGTVVRGVVVPSEATSTTPPTPGVTSVRPLNSLTTPVTSTESPTSTPAGCELLPNTKTASEAPGVALVLPPLPGVWM